MIYYTTKNEVKGYRDNPAINQSLLKSTFENKKYSGESLVMLLGSYLDALITMPDSEELYIIYDGKRPSESVCDICNKLLEEFSNGEMSNNLSDYALFLEDFLSDKDFYANLAPAAQAKNFITKASDWWEFLTESQDKFIITRSEQFYLKEVAQKVQEVLGKWFNTELLSTSETHHLYFQKEIYWKDFDLSFKGLADIIIETPDVVYEIDLKHTNAKTLNSWAYIARDLNYFFQKSFYRLGLESVFSKPIKQFWLVANSNFVTLVPFTDSMNSFGLLGQNEHKALGNGEVGVTLKKHKYGVMEAIEFFKNPIRETKEVLNKEEAEALFYGG